MTRVVYRYEVPVDDQWHTLPITGRVVHVAARTPDVVEMWAIHVDRIPNHSSRYRVFGTGHDLPPEAGRHVGTALAADGALVWHLFEGDPLMAGEP